MNNFTVSVGTNKGDGYASEMFRVTVESSLGDFKLLLKKPHEVKERLDFVKDFDLYNRETSFYLKDYSALVEILKSVNEFEPFAPELFYADRGTDLLVLRDLRDEGYSTGDRFSRVSREHGKILMRKMAKMHASSMVLNQRLEGQLEEKEFKMFTGEFLQMMINHIAAVAKDMETWGEDYQPLIPKVKYCVEHFKELNLKNVQSKRGLNVLIHGDPWFNNMLLRGDQKKEEDLDVLLIDFQTVSWATLAIDLIYFTVTSLSADDFENREELIAEYHGHLERVLKKLNYKNVPSLRDVVNEYKDRFLHAFYATVIKLIAYSDTSANVDDFVGEKEEVLLKRVRNPLINMELRNSVKLMSFYGCLDRTVEE